MPAGQPGGGGGGVYLRVGSTWSSSSLRKLANEACAGKAIAGAAQANARGMKYKRLDMIEE
jgi:hypothetical protein